jgi:hypothetical protein
MKSSTVRLEAGTTKNMATCEQLLALLQGDDAMRALLQTTVQSVMEADMEVALGAGWGCEKESGHCSLFLELVSPPSWAMARKLRIQFPGAIYHVINRGNDRRDLFVSPSETQAFLATLREARGLMGWQGHACRRTSSAGRMGHAPQG